MNFWIRFFLPVAGSKTYPNSSVKRNEPFERCRMLPRIGGTTLLRLRGCLQRRLRDADAASKFLVRNFVSTKKVIHCRAQQTQVLLKLLRREKLRQMIDR